MRTEIVNSITEKINDGKATQSDYLTLIEECFSPTSWAIAPVTGIFKCNVGMGKSLQDAFDDAVSSFTTRVSRNP
jgi:hypothetical protein